MLHHYGKARQRQLVEMAQKNPSEVVQEPEMEVLLKEGQISHSAADRRWFRLPDLRARAFAGLWSRWKLKVEHLTRTSIFK